MTGIPAGLDFNWLVNREFGVPGEREGGEPCRSGSPRWRSRTGQRIGVSAHGHNRFIVLDVLQSGDPIIVSQGHATDELGNPFKVTNPGPVFHLPTALAKGELRQLGDPQATVAEGALVGLRPGRLYQGTFEREERQTTQGEPEVRIVISVFYRRAAGQQPRRLRHPRRRHRAAHPQITPGSSPPTGSASSCASGWPPFSPARSWSSGAPPGRATPGPTRPS